MTFKGPEICSMKAPLRGAISKLVRESYLSYLPFLFTFCIRDDRRSTTGLADLPHTTYYVVPIVPHNGEDAIQQGGSDHK